METTDLDRPIWGAENFAPIIGRSLAQTYYLISKGRLDVSRMEIDKLDAKKKGRLYVSTPRRLLASLGIST